MVALEVLAGDLVIIAEASFPHYFSTLERVQIFLLVVAHVSHYERC